MNVSAVNCSQNGSTTFNRSSIFIYNASIRCLKDICAKNNRDIGLPNMVNLS